MVVEWGVIIAGEVVKTIVGGMVRAGVSSIKNRRDKDRFSKELETVVRRSCEQFQRTLENSVFVSDVSAETLKEILEATVIGRLRLEFEDEGQELVVDDEVLDWVVAQSVKRETGARGLASILTRVVEDAAFESFASGLDGRVTLRVAERDGGVLFEVEDRGIGMGARTARRVFDRFYQADRTLARRVGGCGLGLSIVKFVIEAHGGSVAVHSTPGEGSTFTVTLPARDSRVAGRLLEETR